MFRAVSFWIKWDHLDWPNEDVRDDIIRRCDEMAAADVNLAIVFGTHFRWDFLPIMSRVHDMLAFIAEQLHQRDIKFFDHHSSVLTHRVRNNQEREKVYKFNRHHLSFYPDVEFASQMQYAGSSLNDWRMIDVETRQPIYIDTYNCEQFCMNNPQFRNAYQTYLRKLIDEVPLDGLMSDDGVYYAGWRACGCDHCREKFATNYGHQLPPVSDSSFWFNRENKAFRDWIDFRYSTAGEFLGVVREAVGELPLMSCCSNSSGQVCNSIAINYEQFSPHATMAMLEICGRAISEDGKWVPLIVSRAMLQIAITRKYGLDSCLGLGYGFVEDSIELIWQINRLLGTDSWLSTLNGRLALKDSLLESIPEEQLLVGNLFSWEKDYQGLFDSKSDARIAVYFSCETRDYFGRSFNDYEGVYKSACEELFDSNITFDVICDIDEVPDYSLVVLPAAACLSQFQRDVLRKYMQNGGVVIAVGPVGLCDERGEMCDEFLQEYGIDMEVETPFIAGGYQANEDVYSLPAISCNCSCNGTEVHQNDFVKVDTIDGKLYWTPAMDLAKCEPEKMSDIVKAVQAEPIEIIDGAKGWHIRRYRKDDSIVLIGMNSNITPTFSKKFALAFGPQPVVEKLDYENPINSLVLKTDEGISAAKLFATEHTSPFVGEISADGTGVNFSCDEIEKFFVVELKVR